VGKRESSCALLDGTFIMIIMQICKHACGKDWFLKARHPVFVALLLLWIRPAHAESSISPSLEKQLDQMVVAAMRAPQIPAITVAVARANHLLYSKAFGMADLENSVAATTETLFRTASIAKSISAVATMTLVETGKLNLDVPVQTYCPFPPKQWPITTRELLGHTSGIRHYRPGESSLDNAHHYKWMADGFAIFGNDPLLFPPGTGYNYSTYGYTVVGCAIEGAAGVRFQDYVAEHVLKPAGMTHTFVDDVFEIIPNRSRGYQKIEGKVKNADLLDSSYKIPGGGYVTTAEDLVRFAQALLDAKLLRANTVSEMWTSSKQSLASHENYGLGFEVTEGGKYISHGGAQPGTSTNLFIVPEARFAVAVLANMDQVNGQVEDLTRAIVEYMQLPYPKRSKR
jgi:serine beta-lactamase-like protein LACTB, mitochondrial